MGTDWRRGRGEKSNAGLVVFEPTEPLRVLRERAEPARGLLRGLLRLGYVSLLGLMVPFPQNPANRSQGCGDVMDSGADGQGKTQIDHPNGP